MPPPQRVRHNARARQSTAGPSRKKRRLNEPVDENAATEIAEPIDPNAEILELKTKEDRENERKEKMKAEIIQASESKWSSKKKKRLESYINKKLKKDERLVLFQKLAASQAELPSSLSLHSSATLGTGKSLTHAERFAKVEDKQVRKAMDGVGKKGRRRRDNFSGDLGTDEDEGEDEDGFGDSQGELRMKSPDVDAVERMDEEPAAVTPSVTQAVTQTVVEVGSALQRDANGNVIQPKIVKRKPKQKKFWGKQAARQQAAEESSDSFDSSDSANDSDSVSNEESEEEWGGIQWEDTGQMTTESRDVEAQKTEETDDSDDGTEDEDSENEEEEDTLPTGKRKRGGFKEWAQKQVDLAKGYAPPSTSDTLSQDHDTPATPILTTPLPSYQLPRRKDAPAEEIKGPLGEVLSLPSSTFASFVQSKQASSSANNVVNVDRPVDIQAGRLLLPILSEEQPIMEAIRLNPVVIICGETGSGKTTQVPQFLYEAGFGTPGSDNPGMIGITQPRRVAAMSMAVRVGTELSLPSSRVSYQIRYDATVSPSTSIKFMTDGVLLRELAADFLLNKYSVVIVDEAHERSMNTDVLIGVLSRVVRLREDMWRNGKAGAKPLRLIIMSATLRITDFSENTTLFPSPPPIITIAARQHPVAIHFSRRTSSDYVNEAISKTTKIHCRLPPGGILIFMTRQNEITGICKSLESLFGRKAVEEKKRRRSSIMDRRKHLTGTEVGTNGTTAGVKPSQADVEVEELELGVENVEEISEDVDAAAPAEPDAEALDSDQEDDAEAMKDINLEDSDVPMHILPLYSLLSAEKQMRVFDAPPEDARLVVVATNVAETSLTIPGIKYVVDCGRAKERRYDENTGVQSFPITWISKASASQRAGRAGRTGPGHCYRLYSSAVFENYFEHFPKPEILRLPIEGVVLQMKSMQIDAVVNFPFPTPPDRITLRKAQTVLTNLGALEASATTAADVGGTITDLGRAMSLFPLSPRYSKMLLLSRQQGCLPYMICVVAALSVGDPFLREENLGTSNAGPDGLDAEEMDSAGDDKEERRSQRRAFFASQQHHSALGKASSDIFRLLSVIGSYEYAGGGLRFCEEHFVRPKAMQEIHMLRQQLHNVLLVNFPHYDLAFPAKLPPPNDTQLKVLRQIITAGFIDTVAARRDVVEPKRATGAKFSTCKGVPYKAMGMDEDVFIHPSSVLFNQSPPAYVAFHEVIRSSRTFLKTLTVVNPAWLVKLGPSMCSYSKITHKGAVPQAKAATEGSFVTPHFGTDGWELPPIKQSNE
ncbi:P-loop containing nucleoside triphosphate hydrolase protein [Sistotremastrum niveocremeum HHB9708]|uniref:RNA helicase n=1 Tax=Sistotremastrum niveocremeum HHB9708 TaxID=1314777 RepID=A0A164RD90_9AGAM|nr:P-loop containing nucleoside triphosphate hydrolase protein [Sistotremastrum niveocremeum HHB9708]